MALGLVTKKLVTASDKYNFEFTAVADPESNSIVIFIANYFKSRRIIIYLFNSRFKLEVHIIFKTEIKYVI